jgi:hypothetical protein
VWVLSWVALSVLLIVYAPCWVHGDWSICRTTNRWLVLETDSGWCPYKTRSSFRTMHLKPLGITTPASSLWAPLKEHRKLHSCRGLPSDWGGPYGNESISTQHLLLCCPKAMDEKHFKFTPNNRVIFIYCYVVERWYCVWLSHLTLYCVTVAAHLVKGDVWYLSDIILCMYVIGTGCNLSMTIPSIMASYNHPQSSWSALVYLLT